jgi:hypothetical protein
MRRNPSPEQAVDVFYITYPVQHEINAYFNASLKNFTFHSLVDHVWRTLVYFRNITHTAGATAATGSVQASSARAAPTDSDTGIMVLGSASVMVSVKLMLPASASGCRTGRCALKRHGCWPKFSSRSTLQPANVCVLHWLCMVMHISLDRCTPSSLRVRLWWLSSLANSG